MRKNGRNLFVLLLVVFALYLLDNSRIKKYIGYEKVKEYISKDMDVFSAAKGLFGEKILFFYNLDSPTNTTIIKQEPYGNGYLVFQLENQLYSTFIGTVVKINFNNEKYSIVISGLKGNVLIANISELNVGLYHKIEVGTLIGIIDGCYYYEEI